MTFYRKEETNNNEWQQVQMLLMDQHVLLTDPPNEAI